jgi:hypothetical protein
MKPSVIFTGDSMFKGRNGHSKLHRGTIWTTKPFEANPTYYVEFWSKRQGDHPPVSFNMTKSDYDAMRQFMIDHPSESL